MGKCRECNICHDDIVYLEKRLEEEAYKVGIMLQALQCIIEPRDQTDPVKIAQETLEAYAARKGG